MDEKINSWQATALLTISILPTAILFPLSTMASLAGRDAWLAFLLAGIYGLLLVVFIIYLNSLYPGMNLIQLAEAVLGKILGKGVIIAYIFFFIILTAIVVREFSAFIVSSFMLATPLELFSIVMVAMAMYASYQGLEVISRVAEIVFIIVVLNLLFFVILGIPELELKALLPFIDSGMTPVFQASLYFFIWTGEIFFISIIYPHLNRPEHAWKVGLITIAVITFFMLAGAFVVESYFGFQFTSRMLFPLLTYVRNIGFVGFWDRIEALVILIWIAGIYIKVSFFMYASLIAIKELFGCSQYRSFIIPVGWLVFILSIIMFENTVEISTFLRDIWSYFAPIYVLVFPLLLFAVGILRKGMGKLSA